MVYEMGYTRKYWYTLSWNSRMSEISSSMNKCKDEKISHANLTAKLTYWPYRLNYTTPLYLTGVSLHHNSLKKF